MSKRKVHDSSNLQISDATETPASHPDASASLATPLTLNESAPRPASDRGDARQGEPPIAAAAGGLFQSNGHCCDEKKRDPNGIFLSAEFSPPTFPKSSPPSHSTSSTEYLTEVAHEEEIDPFLTPSEVVHSPESIGRFVERKYRIRACNCRKWFCPDCGPKLGALLRNRLLMRLESFKNVFGITLTVDGSLFKSPEEAWLYVMRERLLSRLVRTLKERDLLVGGAYFWVVEFQKKTEQPHWHLLVDAARIPFGDLVEIWSRFRPKTATPISESVSAENYRGQAPAFGSVRFTHQGNRAKAAYYTTKYLSKYPAEGYPSWLLDRYGRVPRFGHSQGFFPKKSTHDAMCFCPVCRGDIAPVPSIRKTSTKPARTRRVNAPKTIRERVEQCGQTCSILEMRVVEFPDGTTTESISRFNGTLPVPFAEACEYFGVDPNANWQIEAPGEEITAYEKIVRTESEGRAA